MALSDRTWWRLATIAAWGVLAMWAFVFGMMLHAAFTVLRWLWMNL